MFSDQSASSSAGAFSLAQTESTLQPKPSRQREAARTSSLVAPERESSRSVAPSSSLA